MKCLSEFTIAAAIFLLATLFFVTDRSVSLDVVSPTDQMSYVEKTFPQPQIGNLAKNWQYRRESQIASLLDPRNGQSGWVFLEHREPRGLRKNVAVNAPSTIMVPVAATDKSYRTVPATYSYSYRVGETAAENRGIASALSTSAVRYRF